MGGVCSQGFCDRHSRKLLGVTRAASKSPSTTLDGIESDNVLKYIISFLDLSSHKRWMATCSRLRRLGKHAWTWKHDVSVWLYGMNAGRCDFNAVEHVAREHFADGDGRRTKLLALLDMERHDWQLGGINEVSASGRSLGALSRLRHVAVTIAPLDMETYFDANSGCLLPSVFRKSLDFLASLGHAGARTRLFALCSESVHVDSRAEFPSAVYQQHRLLADSPRDLVFAGGDTYSIDRLRLLQLAAHQGHGQACLDLGRMRSAEASVKENLRLSLSVASLDCTRRIRVCDECHKLMGSSSHEPR
jgi:hypothetical protein